MRLTRRMPDRWRPRGRWRWPFPAIAALFVALAGAGFVAGRSFAPGWTQADDQVGDVDPATVPPDSTFEVPDRDVTPEPGSTPDRSEPYWNIPYLNQERLAPKFRGELAGLAVGQSLGALASCSAEREAQGNAAMKAIAGTPFDIDLAKLPDGVSVADPPVVGLCADGSAAYLRATLLHPKGGAVQLDRVRGLQHVVQEASERRWSEGTIAGRPAVFLDTVIDRTGMAGVFVRDDDISGLTQLLGPGATLAELTELMEALYR